MGRKIHHTGHAIRSPYVYSNQQLYIYAFNPDIRWRMCITEPEAAIAALACLAYVTLTTHVRE